MRYAGPLSPEQFEAILVGQERFYRSWTGPWYGLDGSWTGARIAGDAAEENGVLRFVSLAHGDVDGHGPLVDVGVTSGDPVALAQRLARPPRPLTAPPPRSVPPVPGVDGAEETTMFVDGTIVAALRWPTAGGWAAAATLAGPAPFGLAVAAERVRTEAVRLVQVELEPYLAGRRQLLHRGYGG